MLGAEGVHSTLATGVSFENRTLGRPETTARPRLLSVLQPPRLIPWRDSPRSTEAPAQCHPRRWDPRASRSRPPQHRRQRAGRRPAPLQGPTASGAPGPALHAGCPPDAHALPRAHPPSSHSATVPTSPPPRVPEADRAPTHRVGLRCPAPPTVQRGRSPWSSGGSRCPGPRPLQTAKSLPSRGPGASAWSWFLQQARGPLERDSCAEKKNQPTALKWGGVWRERGTRRGRGLHAPPRLHRPCHAPCRVPYTTPCLGSRPLSPPSLLLPAPPKPLPSPLFHRAPPLLPATPLYPPGQVLSVPALSATGRPRA